MADQPKLEEKMEYGFLSPSCGLKVSKICLGAMTFGQSEKARFQLPGQADEAGSHKLMDRFVELGGNFIDTANIYSGGESEKIVGTWLQKQQRSDVVIATKCFNPTANETGPNDTGLSRNNIIKSIEKSLERLQTNYIDLYQVHSFDWGAPQKETLMTLNDLVRCGKVRYIGASNFCGYQLMEALNIAEYMGLEKYVTLQNQYSLLCRDCEFDVFEVCKQKGVGVLPWSPLKSGILTDKNAIRGSKTDENSRQGWLEKLPAAMVKNLVQHTRGTLQDNDEFWKMMDAIKKIGKANEKSIAQVSLKYLIQKKHVSSVIIGAKRMEQLEDNVKAGFGWSLTSEEIAELDEASKFALHVPYPFGSTSSLSADRKRAD